MRGMRQEEIPTTVPRAPITTCITSETRFDGSDSATTSITEASAGDKPTTVPRSPTLQTEQRALDRKQGLMVQIPPPHRLPKPGFRRHTNRHGRQIVIVRLKVQYSDFFSITLHKRIGHDFNVMFCNSRYVNGLPNHNSPRNFTKLAS